MKPISTILVIFSFMGSLMYLTNVGDNASFDDLVIALVPVLLAMLVQFFFHHKPKDGGLKWVS